MNKRSRSLLSAVLVAGLAVTPVVARASCKAVALQQDVITGELAVALIDNLDHTATSPVVVIGDSVENHALTADRLALSCSGSSAYAAEGPKVFVIDNEQHVEVDEIELPASVHGIELTQDGETLWVGTVDGIYTIDNLNDPVSRTVSLVLAGAAAASITSVNTPSGEHMFVVGGGAIRVFDAASLELVANVTIPSAAFVDAASCADGSLFVVSEIGGYVHFFDPVFNTLIDSVGVSAGAYGVDVDPDCTTVFVNTWFADIQMIDVATRTNLCTLELPGSANSFGLDVSILASGELGYASSNAGDGAWLYETSSAGQVTAITTGQHGLTVVAPRCDADGDRVSDACDNCSETYNPRLGTLGAPEPETFQSTTGEQLDDDADGFGNQCDAKFVAGGVFVGGADVTHMRASFNKARSGSNCGTSGAEACARYDLDGNGDFVGPPDMTRARQLFGKEVGPKCNACPLLCDGPACP